MRAKNINTMYRRRSVRPDSQVYRQIRKAPGAARPGGGAGKIRLGPVGVIVVVGLLIVLSLVIWLLRR